MSLKKILSILLLAFVTQCYSQEVKTVTIKDWNTLRNSGFFEADLSRSSNNPGSHAWYWGINIAHTYNSLTLDRPYYFGGQILFGVNYNSLNIPNVYVRSTNVDGVGLWAKLLHSKGDHAIDGKLTVKEVEVKINTGADFVFDKDYKLPDLEHLEHYINKHKHLPDIESEKDMLENGLNINEFQIKLLQKIEELTLYVIELNKENKKLNNDIKLIKIENNNLKYEIQQIEDTIGKP